MTEQEYFAISIPTDKDFKLWTKSFLARADNVINGAEKYLSEITTDEIYNHKN